MSVMLPIGAILVLKEKLLSSCLMPKCRFIYFCKLKSTSFLYLELFSSEEIAFDRGTFQYSLIWINASKFTCF